MVIDDDYIRKPDPSAKSQSRLGVHYSTRGPRLFHELSYYDDDEAGYTFNKFLQLTAGLHKCEPSLFANLQQSNNFDMAADIAKEARKNLPMFLKASCHFTHNPALSLMASIMMEDDHSFERILATTRYHGTGQIHPLFANALGLTPLMAAAFCGNAFAVEKLLKHPLVGANEDYAGSGHTALFYAGVAYSSTKCPPRINETIKKLVAAGGDISAFYKGANIDSANTGIVLKKIGLDKTTSRDVSKTRLQQIEAEKAAQARLKARLRDLGVPDDTPAVPLEKKKLTKTFYYSVHEIPYDSNPEPEVRQYYQTPRDYGRGDSM